LAFAQGTLYETTQNDTDYLGITCFFDLGVLWCATFRFRIMQRARYGSNFWIPNHGSSAKQFVFFASQPEGGRGRFGWCVSSPSTMAGRERIGRNFFRSSALGGSGGGGFRIKPLRQRDFNSSSIFRAPRRKLHEKWMLKVMSIKLRAARPDTMIEIHHRVENPPHCNGRE